MWSEAMKYIICFLLFACTSIASAQDLGPERLKFYLNGDSTYIDTDHEYFQYEDFMIGSHWGAPSDSALRCGASSPAT
jgi:hypothetical protein